MTACRRLQRIHNSAARLIFMNLSLQLSNTATQVTWLLSPRSEAQAYVWLRGSWRPWWMLLQHSIMLPLVGTWRATIYYVASSFHRRVWYRALSLRYACIRSSGIIFTPRLPLCQISFFGDLHCWASPWRKLHTQSLNHSITHSPRLFDAPETEALALRKRLHPERNEKKVLGQTLAVEKI